MPEELDWLTLEQKYVKPLKHEDKPLYTEEDKKIIAWSIAWDGAIGIGRTRRQPRIGITSIEFELLEQLHKIVKLGNISRKPYKPHGLGKEPTKKWYVTSYRECLFLLQNIKPYIPSYRKRKIAQLTIEFIKSRLTKHDNNLPLEHDIRELEIAKEVQKLNKKGKK